MVDSLTLCKAQNHKVKLVEEDDTEHIAVLDFYESEWDSGYGVAAVGLTDRSSFKADEIKSIEILD